MLTIVKSCNFETMRSRSAADNIRVTFKQAKIMTNRGSISITVNDQSHEIVEHSTVAELIEQKGLRNRAVAVEVNFVLIPQTAFDQTVLRQADHVEIVTLSGGG